jgi:hypothetical protein
MKKRKAVAYVTLYKMGMSRLREESQDFRDRVASIVTGSVTSLKKTRLTIGSHPSVTQRGERKMRLLDQTSGPRASWAGPPGHDAEEGKTRLARPTREKRKQAGPGGFPGRQVGE